jgi:hypothetical protein
MIMAWFAARLVPIGAGLAVVLAVFAWDRVRISKAETRGAEKVITQSKNEGKKINEKNAQVFSSAERPGAAERVRQRFCRDC